MSRKRVASRRIAAAFSVALACSSLVACHANQAPVLNVVNAPVYSYGTPLGEADVRAAIARGLAVKGWTIESEQPRLIRARVDVPPHWARVQIPYSDRGFSIYHAGNSPSLKFDGERIHRRYNHWIDRLRAAITAELRAPGPPGRPAPAPSPDV